MNRYYQHSDLSDEEYATHRTAWTRYTARWIIWCRPLPGELARLNPNFVV